MGLACAAGPPVSRSPLLPSLAMLSLLEYAWAFPWAPLHLLLLLLKCWNCCLPVKLLTVPQSPWAPEAPSAQSFLSEDTPIHRAVLSSPWYFLLTTRWTSDMEAGGWGSLSCKVWAAYGVPGSPLAEAEQREVSTYDV